MLGGVFYFKPKLFEIMKEYNDEVRGLLYKNADRLQVFHHILLWYKIYRKLQKNRI